MILYNNILLHIDYIKASKYRAILDCGICPLSLFKGKSIRLNMFCGLKIRSLNRGVHFLVVAAMEV